VKAKLQKQLAYEYKGKRHFKYVLVVPDDAIDKLGWKGGRDLEINVENGKLMVEIQKAGKKRP
jgi:bifunctional DNA-binding transcriptional regulator/antitoxin component of YhaV-PrlF toxin-antitoxin module